MRFQRTHLFAPLLAASLIVTTLLIGVMAQPASANHGARITIHAAKCEMDVPPEERYAQCHDNRIAGVPFYVAGIWRETDANGVVSWTPGAGMHWIYPDEAYFIPGEDGTHIYCENQVTGDVLWNQPASDWRRSIEITTTAGQEVVCDWYILQGLI